MNLKRTSEQIKAEIESTFGFVPPFFEPALQTPQVLENLWQQTLAAYLNNPLPTLFKEKLSAYLSRFCVIPYCLVCHSCTLRPLGIKASEILALLSAPLMSETDVGEYLSLLVVQPAPLTEWPEPNSPLEHLLFYSSVFIASQDACDPFRRELHRILGTQDYQHLIALLAYIKTCHRWMEAHPEVNYEIDKRVSNHLGALLEEEPALAKFFGNYHERVKHEYQSQAQQLAELAEYKHQRQQTELKRLMSRTARLQKANEKLKSQDKKRIAELEVINEQLRAEIAERKRLELQLRRKEQELSDFVENGAIGLHWVGPDGIILWANQAELDLLGYTREEYIGHHIAEFHTDQAVIEDILQRLTAKETLHDYEAGIKAKDGSIKYVLIDSNVFYENERFIHTRCFTRDCTVRKQAEQALKQAYNDLKIRFKTMQQTQFKMMNYEFKKG